MVSPVRLVPQARTELTAQLDSKVQREPLALLVRPVLLVPRVQLARRERMELMARSVSKVQRDQPV